MIDNLTVDLAPFLNWVIYIILFFVVNFLIRRLIRITYGRKIVRICKGRILEVFAEHYKEHGVSKRMLEKKLYAVNKEMRVKFNLNYNPFSWCYLDNEYGDYDEISGQFGVDFIEIYKRMWLYHMRFRKYDKYKERILYKDCMKENRDNKIDNLLD